MKNFNSIFELLQVWGLQMGLISYDFADTGILGSGASGDIYNGVGRIHRRGRWFIHFAFFAEILSWFFYILALFRTRFISSLHREGGRIQHCAA